MHTSLAVLLGLILKVATSLGPKPTFHSTTKSNNNKVTQFCLKFPQYCRTANASNTFSTRKVKTYAFCTEYPEFCFKKTPTHIKDKNSYCQTDICINLTKALSQKGIKRRTPPASRRTVNKSFHSKKLHNFTTKPANIPMKILGFVKVMALNAHLDVSKDLSEMGRNYLRKVIPK